jgi:acyl-CoA synthetase (AMP-forming)/AMP-acid ligase II
MHPRHWAAVNPHKPAIIAARSGESISYRELNERSIRCANLLSRAGLRAGDHLAMIMENHPRFLEISWAAQRSGLYFTPISWRFQPGEVEYIVRHSGARALIVSSEQRPLAQSLSPDLPAMARFLVGGVAPGYTSYEAQLESSPSRPVYAETRGIDMLYSSGSTGTPKAVKLAIEDPRVDGPSRLYRLFGERFGWGESTMYLMPAPLYHSGPLRFAMAMGYFGGTVIVMELFDARASLELCQRYRVTHVQWVPTMMVRLLKLPREEREAYDLSSLQCVIHGAAPISVEVKRAMIDWVGPILEESYSGTEGNGATLISSAEWLAHPGSVGRAAFGTLHIVDERGEELPAGQTGQIYFDGPRFEYYKDPERTRDAYDARGWSTLGDIGYLDDEGYLYLTDRKSDVIISGGVNVYPIEAEHVLTAHPRVLDAAVFGLPDDDLGEIVHAVVQPVRMDDAGPELERELLEYCGSKIARFKCPRAIDFRADLPRHETGKLYKRLIRLQYLESRAGRRG